MPLLQDSQIMKSYRDRTAMSRELAHEARGVIPSGIGSCRLNTFDTTTQVLPVPTHDSVLSHRAESHVPMFGRICLYHLP